VQPKAVGAGKLNMSIHFVSGGYSPGNSPIHRLQARTKLLLMAWIVVWLVISHRFFWHFTPAMVVLALSFGGLLLAGISLRTIWQRMWLITLLLLLSAIPILFSTGLDNRRFYAIGPFLTTYGFVDSFLLATGCLLLVLLIASRVPQWRAVYRVVRRLRFLSVLLFLADLLAYWLLSDKPARMPLPIGPFVITYGGVWTLQTVYVMLLALFALSLLMTMTTSPVALIEGLLLLLAPLRKLKLPVDDFALMSLLALRFIPTLLEEMEQLIKAQTARGADLAHGSLAERMQSLIMLFTPLLQGIFRRADELATALEARGYESEGQQTILHETNFGAVDYTVISVVMVVTVAALFF
jgi:energy-coupling factor transport system permease protein